MNSPATERIANRRECPTVRPRSPAKKRLAFLVLLLFATLTSSMRAQVVTPTELQVKAAYLYKFGAFVQWPSAAPRESFTICVLGHDPFGPTLDATLSGGSIDGSAVVAKRISGAQEASQCRIVYVSSSEGPRLKSILQTLNQLPVLTVSDMPRFVDSGGMIQFVLENGRVRFDVNLASAEKAGLGLSSQLLKVASAVKRDEGGD